MQKTQCSTFKTATGENFIKTAKISSSTKLKNYASLKNPMNEIVLE